MDGLAFLPVGDVKDGMAYLKNIDSVAPNLYSKGGGRHPF